MNRKGPVEIRVTGRFTAFRGDDANTPVLAPALLARLDGHRVESDPLSNHLPFPLNELVFGGELSFRHRPDDAHLTGVTRYVARSPLAPDELKALVEATQGQWFDGIGESLVVPLDGEEVVLSANLRKLELRSEQQHTPGLKVPAVSPIFSAIKAGKLERVRTLAAKGHLGNRDRYRSTPLHVAIVAKQTEIALAIVELDPGAAGRTQELVSAARMGNVAVVDALLAAGVPASACEDIFAGADPNGRITGLMAAASGAASFTDLPTAQQTIAALLGAGADPNQASPDTGMTALFSLKDPAIARQLLAAGADPSHRCKRGSTAAEHHAWQRGHFLESSDPYDAQRVAKLAEVIAALEGAER